MKTIKVMADYQCYPLWEASPGQVGNIDPRSLPISKNLCRELLAWAEIFDATLNVNDPTRSGFNTSEDVEEFIAEGNKLSDRLSAELGEHYIVTRNIRGSTKQI